MRRNRLRELLKADKPTIGTHIHSSWPTIIEMVGHSHMFDYVEFVGEYAPYDLYALDNIGRAVELFPQMSAMMKIEQEPRTYLSVRAIGAGIQNLLFADPRTVADVEECVRAVRADAPHAKGRHGVGMRRDVRCVLEGGSPAFVQALDDAVVALMIEKAPAVENRPGRLFDEPRPGWAMDASARTGGRTLRHRDRVEARHRAAGGDYRSRRRSALPRHGREAFLHRDRREHLVPMVRTQWQVDALAPRPRHERGRGSRGADRLHLRSGGAR
jgi:hypothetical protein